MLVPPDRGTILGRALWKPRYVVLGTGAKRKTQNDLMGESRAAGSSRKELKSSSSKVDVQQQADDGLYISIYKAKGDWEFVAQHPVSAFKSCEIRNVAHRKQSPSLPTLMLDFKPETDHEKQRRRRSSRSTGLSSRDPWEGTLLFRSVSDERYSIYDWQLTLKPQLTPDTLESFESLDDLQSPMSPTSPTFSFSSNPFAPRDTRIAASSNTRPEFQQRTPSNQPASTYPHAPRERPSAMISPSPSLRSRRSDLSSQGSSLQPPMGFTSSHPKTYNTGLPSDLPSPASAYDNQFIEGWTSAQGRSSALSSHTRGSNSIASTVAAASLSIGSTPPGPRETILDRAFQMKCIPGSERIQDKDEAKISSIARFEALMREADERERQKSISSNQGSSWDLDEESEDSASGEFEEEEEDDDDDAEELDISDHDLVIPTPAQRALDYISGRQTPLATSRPLSSQKGSPPIPFSNPQAMSALDGNFSSGGGLRPRTGTCSSQRNSRPSSMALPSRSVSTTAVPKLKDEFNSNNLNPKAGDLDAKALKRSSSTSVKRLSFTEFAKRLSSTSSLLLVQTNASSSSGRDGSRRTSSEYGAEEERMARHTSVGVRGSAPSNAERDSRDKKCVWRGSVGVFGSEGGFL